jgi:hypothetical protein
MGNEIDGARLEERKRSTFETLEAVWGNNI